MNIQLGLQPDLKIIFNEGRMNEALIAEIIRTIKGQTTAPPEGDLDQDLIPFSALVPTAAYLAQLLRTIRQVKGGQNTTTTPAPVAGGTIPAPITTT